MSSTTFYVVAFTAAIATFFVVWAILHDEVEENPWIGAGLIASVVLASSVLMREVLLLRANRRENAAARMAVSVRGVPLAKPRKFTLEQNAELIEDIRKRSEAAKLLGKFSEGHRSVFELCERYLEIASKELPHVGVGSPRLAALTKGSKTAGRIHRYHMLSWAEIEARSLMQNAREQENISEKVESSRKALGVLEAAMRNYPTEESFIESHKAIRDYILNAKIADWTDQAQRAEYKGDLNAAVGLYQDAMFDLENDESETAEKEAILERLRGEIERLRSFPGNGVQRPPTDAIEV